MLLAGASVAHLIVHAAWQRGIKPMCAKQPDEANPWFERWAGVVVRSAAHMGFDTLPRLRASWLVAVGRIRRVRASEKTLDGSEQFLQRWPFAVTLFLVLGVVVVALVGASSWLG